MRELENSLLRPWPKTAPSLDMAAARLLIVYYVVKDARFGAHRRPTGGPVRSFGCFGWKK